MSFIYHYCSVDSFFNIIKNRSIWLSNVLKMNDHMEVHWSLGEINRQLKSMKTESNAPFIEKFMQGMNHKAHRPYIASFSTNGDLLSQWRGYADGGNGISIGISSDFLAGLRDKAPTPEETFEYSILALHDMKYDSSYKNKISSVLNRLNIIDGKLGQTPTERLDSYVLMSELDSIIVQTKNPSFKEECEKRIAYYPARRDRHPNDPKVASGFSVSGLKYRPSKNNLIDYFEFLLHDETGKKPEIEIIIGPKCLCSEYDVRNYCSSKGFNVVDVRKSASSLR